MNGKCIKWRRVEQSAFPRGIIIIIIVLFVWRDDDPLPLLLQQKNDRLYTYTFVDTFFICHVVFMIISPLITTQPKLTPMHLFKHTHHTHHRQHSSHRKENSLENYVYTSSTFYYDYYDDTATTVTIRHYWYSSMLSYKRTPT